MEKPIVTINEGKLQGTTLSSVLGPSYLAFKGIPYAQPPIGSLRFQAPRAALKWEGVRDASEHAGDVAMQNLVFGEPPYQVIGSEDCLYLNVYVNKIDGRKRPVMFYIHGGGFVEGNANQYIYRQDYLVTQDMLLVFVNFRMGALGSLNLGDEVAPGNQGLRDIIMALEWTKRNIAAFGGDPDNVTIFGNSSGSMVCHLFTLLPVCKGLFHKAILQSGSIFIQRNLVMGDDFKNGFRIASLLGMQSDDPVKVIKFLRTVPAEELIKLEFEMLTKEEEIIMGLLAYGAVYDGEFCKDPIIPQPLPQLIKNDAQIPIIVGNLTEESLLSFVGKFNDDKHFKFYNDNIEKIMKNSLMLKDESRFPEIMKEIRDLYLKNQPITKENVGNLIRLLTDIDWLNYNRKLVDMRNEHAQAPTYVYNFYHLGNEPTFYQYDHGPQPVEGVAHANELSYMFYIAYMREGDERGEHFPQEGTVDRLVMERLVRMWYNFAAFGNPTPKTDDKYITTVWKPVTKENLYYLDIGEKLTLKEDKDTESRKLYEKFRDIYLF